MSSIATVKYQFKALGVVTGANLATAMAAVALPQDLLNALGVYVPVGNDTTTAGPPVQRQIAFSLIPNTPPTATVALAQPGASGSPLALPVITGAGDHIAAPPAVLFTGANATAPGILRKAQAVVDLKLVGLDIVAAGSGYTSVPTVSFGGGLGVLSAGKDVTGAKPTLPTAHVTIVANAISTAVVDTAGNGLIGIPTVFVTGGGGTGGVLAASLGLSAFGLLDGGKGYAAAPLVGFKEAFHRNFPADGSANEAAPFVQLLTNLFANALGVPITATAVALS